MSSAPLAIHRESNVERKGTFTLYAERVDINMSYQLRSSISLSVTLDDLLPRTAVIRTRNSFFNLGLWALLLSVTPLSVLLALNVSVSNGLLSVLYSVIVFGVFLVLFGLRKLRFVAFYGKDGTLPFSIGEGPGGPSALDSFVAQLKAAIEFRRSSPAA